MLEKFLEYIKNKKVLILGFGREGQSTYRHLRDILPSFQVDVADRMNFENLDVKSKSILNNDKNCTGYFGVNYLAALKNYDIVIKTPGIPNKHKEIKDAKEAGVLFTSQTKIFFDECKGKVIGITGTKGKSTTTSLIHNILKIAGLKTVIIGNIGKPPLDYLKEDNLKMNFVYEMSSHQLADLNKSPHISVFLNIFPEHLDYYENFEDYFNAKKNIAKFQKPDDYFIFNFDDQKVRGVARDTNAKTLSFSKTYKKDAFIGQDSIFVREGKNTEEVIKIINLNLRGSHNYNNIMAAILAAKCLGVSLKDIKKGIKSFAPLPVRLEEVGVFRGIKFVLDALATIPEATIAALESYSGNVGTLICGGFDRGQNYNVLAMEIVKRGVQNLILFPTTGQRIWQEVEALKATKKNKPNHFFVDNMEEAIKTCYSVTPNGKVCLLSAASSSFSVFKNYEEEAKLFRQYVKEYSK